MFESLDSVDWGSLHGCYQPATDMAELLRSLLSPVAEVRDAAIERIGSAVFHQGTVFSVSPVVIPFLFELLDNDQTHDKDFIVGLLTTLSSCCAYLESNVISAVERSRMDAEFREAGTSFNEEMLRERDLVDAVRSEIEKRFDLIYPYLRFPDDPWIRMAVAETLARYPEFAARLRADLKAAFEAEMDEFVRDAIAAAMAIE